jgi:hypothetical protein
MTIAYIKDMEGNVLYSSGVRASKYRVWGTPNVYTTKQLVLEACKAGVSLANADLRKASLSGADLSGARLAGANLQQASLSDTNLSGADLRGADLTGSWLCDSSLRGADLNGSCLRGASLRGADLTGSFLCGADLRGAALAGAVLKDAILDAADLRGADLCGALMTPMDLVCVKLSQYHQSSYNILRTQRGPLRLYKYLTTAMQSPYYPTVYEVGKTYISENACDDTSLQCGPGINVATLQWCLQDTRNDLSNFIYVEVEVDPRDLIVPRFSDGKFRIRSGGKITITRALTPDEITAILQKGE